MQVRQSHTRRVPQLPATVDTVPVRGDDPHRARPDRVPQRSVEEVQGERA